MDLRLLVLSGDQDGDRFDLTGDLDRTCLLLVFSGEREGGRRFLAGDCFRL